MLSFFNRIQCTFLDKNTKEVENLNSKNLEEFMNNQYLKTFSIFLILISSELLKLMNLKGKQAEQKLEELNSICTYVEDLILKSK